MSKHYVFKMMVMNEEAEQAVAEDVSPNQLLYGPRILEPENPGTSKQQKQQNSIPRSPDDISLHSISSSSTDLSSPPRAFPKRSKIVPEKKATYQINIKKSRWEPISSGEEKRRFEALLKSKKVKKKKKTKGKRRKEMVNEAHRDGDHFRPLKKFVNNRRKLATELLDSVDLETLYEIFPELEEKTETETHKIVYDILCGMSRGRILADLNGDELPESSAESDASDISSNQEDNKELNQSTNSESEETEKSQTSVENDEIMENKEENNKQIPIKMFRKKKKILKEDDLEEGEIRSKMGISEEESNLEEELMESISNEEVELIEDRRVEEKKVENGVVEEKKEKDILSNKIKMEPTFIVSVDCCSLSDKYPEDFEAEEDNLSQSEKDISFEQRIVCILPPSPTSSITINVGEEEEENRNEMLEIEQQEEETRLSSPSCSSNLRNEVILEENDQLQVTDIDDVEDIDFELVEN
ncbi:hypothetical protein ACQ4LE_003970 [Meloidogyne hapla]|uniref:Uncharacterized protein n=1 Tax=Meloidogyne hapla TaxID=6305 RepID=A0A1I8BQ92_MELHA